MSEEDIFLQAIQIESPAQRSEFLDQACGGDENLRRGVDGLLQAHEGVGTFLENPILETPNPQLTETLNTADRKTPTPNGRRESVGAPPQVPGYDIIDELGRGGMGVVYRARQLKANRLVALKVILAEDHTGSDALQRFRTETESIARLQHPGIVQIFEVGEYQGKPFCSLEYCAAGSLDAFLSRTPLPDELAAKIVRNIAQAIQAAHDAKVIHRDLKPANILLQNARPKTPNDDGARLKNLQGATYKITDFGLAKKLDEATHTKTDVILGTPSYMAPEQARHGPEIGAATDVYALGAILYECITGRPPFVAAHSLETVMQVVRDDPVPPRQLQPGLSRDLETICLKCLQKDPKRRYTSAQALADDLERFIEQRPIQARAVGQGEKLYRWTKRNPIIATLVASLFFVLFIGVGVSSSLAIIADGEAERADLEADQAHIARVKAEKLAASEEDAKEQALRAKRKAEQLAESERTAKKEALIAKEIAVELAVSERKARKAAEAQRIRVEKLLYAGHLKLAMRYWISKEIDSAWTALAQTNPNYRGWEYHFVDTLFRKLGRSELIPENDKNILCLDVSPNGRRLACARGDIFVRAQSHAAQIEIWDLDTGEKTCTLQGHRDYVACLAFSPDGRRLVSGSRDATVKIWDVEAAACLHTLRGHTDCIHSVAFHPDGRRIASAGFDRMIKSWNVENGKGILTIVGHRQNINCIAYSLDGKFIVSAEGSPRHRIAIGPRGKRVLKLTVKFDNPSQIKVWNAKTGAEKFAFAEHTDSIYSVAFHPNGRHFVTGSADTTAKIWDLQTGRVLRTLTGHDSMILRAVVSPDGTRIATSGHNGTVKIWDAADGKELFTYFRHEQPIEALVYHPDARCIVSGSSDGSIKLWDTMLPQAPRKIVANSGKFRCSTLSPDGRTIVFTNQIGIVRRKIRNIWIVDADSRVVRRQLQGHRSDITCIAFSHDGKRFVTGSRDKTAIIWDIQTGRKLATLRDHKKFVESVAFSPDDSRIVTGSWDKTIKIWDPITGTVIDTLRGHKGNVYGAVFSPDSSRIVSICGATRLRPNVSESQLLIWDANSGKQLFLHLLPRLTPRCLAISPNGRMIAVGARNMIKIWDLATGKESRKPLMHTSSISALTFTPDGKRIVSGSYDGTISFWETESGIRIFDLQGHTEMIANLTFAKDGHRLVSSTRDQTIYIWDAFAGDNTPSFRRRFAGISATSHWHQKQADSAATNGDHFAQAFHLRRLTRSQPWCAEWNAKLAVTLSKMNARDEAAIYFVRACLLNPKVTFPK